MKQNLRLGRSAASLIRSIERSKPSPILQAVPVRTFHCTGLKYEEKGKDEPKGSASFRGQLYESTSDRLKREREAEARYIKAQRERGREPRTLALSAGVYLAGIISTGTDLLQ